MDKCLSRHSFSYDGTFGWIFILPVSSYPDCLSYVSSDKPPNLTGKSFWYKNTITSGDKKGTTFRSCLKTFLYDPDIANQRTMTKWKRDNYVARDILVVMCQRFKPASLTVWFRNGRELS